MHLPNQWQFDIAVAIHAHWFVADIGHIERPNGDLVVRTYGIHRTRGVLLSVCRLPVRENATEKCAGNCGPSLVHLTPSCHSSRCLQSPLSRLLGEPM